MQRYDIVIPIYWDAVDIIGWSISYLQKNLNPARIVFIGPSKIANMIPKGQNIFFIDGNTIARGMTKESIADIIREIAPGTTAYRRAGWYLQQMIKLGYAQISQEELYLVWDADAVPMQKLEFYDEGTKKGIFFSGGRHHHLTYYKSISRLLEQNILPSNENTYVGHYMLMMKHIVKDMLQQIERNETLHGNIWWEKIMYSIEADDIGKSGFSEFETYGEFVNLYYPNSYWMREDICNQTSTRLFLGNHPTEEKLQWAGKEFQILGFEANIQEKRFWRTVCHVVCNRVAYSHIVRLYEKSEKLRIRYFIRKLRRMAEKLKKKKV